MHAEKDMAYAKYLLISEGRLPSARTGQKLSFASEQNSAFFFFFCSPG